jgi:ABC-type transport system substrate-binding protein
MVDDNNQRESSSDVLSRRKLLGIAGGSIVGLAGCSGDGDSGTEDGTPTGDGDNDDDGESSPTPSPTPHGQGTMPAGEAGYPRPDGLGSKPVPLDLSTIEYPYSDLSEDELVDDMPLRIEGSDFDLTRVNNSPYSPGQRMMWHPRKRLSFFEVAGMGVDNATLFYPLVGLESWELTDPCTLQWKLREDMQWWDGSAVTSQDIQTQWRINNYLSDGIDFDPDTTETVEVVDDYTLNWTRPAPYNEVVAASKVDPGGNGMITHKQGYWGEYREGFEDATSQSEIDSVTENLTELSLRVPDIVENDLGCGLWIPDLDTLTPNEVIMRKNEDHRMAHITNLNKWKLRVEPDQQKRQSAFRNDQGDIHNMVTGEWIQLYNNGTTDQRQISHSVASGGWRYIIGTHNEHLAKRGVRRAMLYQHSPNRVAQLKEKRILPAPGRGSEAGLNKFGRNRFLGQDWMDENLINYGQTARTEKAAEAMRAEGYEKSGGKWQDEDGNTPEVTFMSFKTGPRLVVSQVIEEQMSSFGFDTNLKTVSGSAVVDIMKNQHDEWDVIHMWGQHTLPTGITGYPATNVGNTIQATSAVDPDWSPDLPSGCQRPDSIEAPPLTSETDWMYDRKIRPEVNEIGNTSLELGSNTFTLYPIKWTLEMANAATLDDMIPHARKLAWYANWDAIGFGVQTGINGATGDDASFSYGNWTYDPVWTQNPVRNIGMGWITGRNEKVRHDNPVANIRTPERLDVPLETLYPDQF